MSKVRHKGALVIVIVDDQNNVFGAFLSESFRTSGNYYGSAECCLFKFDQHDYMEVSH